MSIIKKRIKFERGGLYTEDGEPVTLFSPGVAEHVARLWNESLAQPGYLTGRFVRVDNPRFTGYGYAEYDTGARERCIGVRLENNNIWQYEAVTVRAITPDEMGKVPRGLRERFATDVEVSS